MVGGSLGAQALNDVVPKALALIPADRRKPFEVREVIARHGLSASKALGQNFLFDLNLTGRIARSSGALEGVTVVEVGPGPGGLSRVLLQAGANVTAIARDRRCIPALDELSVAFPGQLSVIEGDALAIGRHAVDELAWFGAAAAIGSILYVLAPGLLIGCLVQSSAARAQIQRGTSGNQMPM